MSDESYLLFAYGTLQDELVQEQVFGRRLVGNRDSLSGYIISSIELSDGSTSHRYPAALGTGLHTDVIQGIAFAVSPNELKLADAYETEAYCRKQVRLGSGKISWVYIKHRQSHPIL